MIRVNHLTKRFRKRTVLDDVSLHFGEGVYGILGPNGAGKTTLMRCMMGLYPVAGARKGKSGLAGRVTGLPPASRIGYLPQRFGLFRELTVYDMMYYFAALKELPEWEREAQIDRALRMVNMDGHKREKVAKLSGGMQRRTGIAQALLGEPEVLFFDEPTAGLDPGERSRFKSVVREIGAGNTVLFSTHIVGDLEEVCDHIIVMDQGRVLYSGMMSELLGDTGEESLEGAYFAITGREYSVVTGMACKESEAGGYE